MKQGDTCNTVTVENFAGLNFCCLTLWMREATTVTQNNYSTLYHIAREATIMAQRSIHVLFSFTHVYLPLSPSICLLRLSEYLSRVFSWTKAKHVRSKHITDSPLRRYEWITMILCTLLHTLWIPRFFVWRECHWFISKLTFIFTE